ncbi:MAG: DUF1223 domain-containing protein [Pseudomonadota bacterium]
MEIGSVHKSCIAVLAALVAPFIAVADDRTSIVSEPASAPVVVELFTSQACPYCPKADKYLAKLAERDDIIALSMPINFWDFTGWSDTLARPEHGARQKAYAKVLGNRRVYTPQAVVNGRFNVKGDKYAKMDAKIAEARENAAAPFSAIVSDAQLRLELPALSLEDPAAIWLISYNSGPIGVPVSGGENKGKVLQYVNVATGMRKIGEWSGAAETVNTSLSLEEAAAECVVLVQKGGVGPVVAAARCDALKTVEANAAL